MAVEPSGDPQINAVLVTVGGLALTAAMAVISYFLKRLLAANDYEHKRLAITQKEIKDKVDLEFGKIKESLHSLDKKVTVLQKDPQGLNLFSERVKMSAENMKLELKTLIEIGNNQIEHVKKDISELRAELSTHQVEVASKLNTQNIAIKSTEKIVETFIDKIPVIDKVPSLEERVNRVVKAVISQGESIKDIKKKGVPQT